MAVVQYSFTAASIRPIDGIISFLDQDNRELGHPHEDALVLALEIGSFMVRRVLVDTESVVDIMHRLVLVQIGYQVSALLASGGILIGFNGSRTTSLGKITLPVTASPVTIFVLFCMIEDPC